MSPVGWLQSKRRFIEGAPELLRRAAEYSIRRAVIKATYPIVRHELGCRRVEREELLDLVDEQGWRRCTLRGARSVSFDPPTFEQSASAEIADATGTYQFDPPFACELRDTTLRGPLALATLSGGRLLPEKEADRSDLLPRGIGHALTERVTTARTPETEYDLATPLVGPMVKTFYHWFADYLVRLECVNAFAEEFGEWPTLLIPENPPSWMSESLELTGYPEEAIEEWRGGTAAVDRLVLPSSRRRHCPWRCTTGFAHYDPAAFEWLREQLGEAAEPVDREWPSTVVISREDAVARRLVNEVAVVDALSSYDPSRVVLSELSIAEQVDLFRSTDLVVAPHGAGLLNMVYGDSLSVVELYGSSLYNALFYSLAEGQDFQYACLKCDEVDGDLVVDTSSLLDAVESVAG